jgi:hypothetical protein
MKTSNTFSILFWAKLASAKNGKATLYARITINGKRAELSLKRKIIISDWNAKKNRLNGISEEAKLINNYLKQVNAELFQSYQKLNSENKLVTSSIVKSHFLGNDENNYALSTIIEYHNEHMKSTLRWGTQKNYFTTHKYIFLFLKQKHKTTDIFLSELSCKFIIDFERFLRSQKSMGNNTVMKHIERLRKMITLAYKIEWISKDPFLKFEAKYERKERTFLTLEELQAIEKKKFDISRLQLIKDLFVFSCYTGLSYGDVMNLSNDNLCIGINNKPWIYAYRQKNQYSNKNSIIIKGC